MNLRQLEVIVIALSMCRKWPTDARSTSQQHIAAQGTPIKNNYDKTRRHESQSGIYRRQIKKGRDGNIEPKIRGRNVCKLSIEMRNPIFQKAKFQPSRVHKTHTVKNPTGITDKRRSEREGEKCRTRNSRQLDVVVVALNVSEVVVGHEKSREIGGLRHLEGVLR